MPNTLADIHAQNMMLLEANTLSELPNIARQLIKLGNRVPIWAFEGEMGAGKTTLIKEICRQLGVTDTVNSPTFSIVNEYQTTSGQPIYHFDFYRIQHPEEAIEIGIFDYFDSGSLCLLEWPTQIEPLLPDHFLHIHISVQQPETRFFNIAHHGQSEKE